MRRSDAVIGRRVISHKERFDIVGDKLLSSRAGYSLQDSVPNVKISALCAELKARTRVRGSAAVFQISVARDCSSPLSLMLLFVLPNLIPKKKN